ncbi:MAG TPA: cobalamin-dependent protein, partial [Polyangia bacterium]|nr:cobalamin-dependent protein [Polyangia bacterium]
MWPKFPRSYWGQEYALPVIGKGAVLPPLGLVTAAALLPRRWSLRLVDLNIEPLDDEALRWADLVMISAMRIQRESFREVVRRARGLGKRIVAGGPYVTTAPDEIAGVDHLVLGEAEEVLP